MLFKEMTDGIFSKHKEERGRASLTWSGALLQASPVWGCSPEQQQRLGAGGGVRGHGQDLAMREFPVAPGGVRQLKYIPVYLVVYPKLSCVCGRVG